MSIESRLDYLESYNHELEQQQLVLVALCRDLIENALDTSNSCNPALEGKASAEEMKEMLTTIGFNSGSVAIVATKNLKELLASDNEDLDDVPFH
ncbi:hypothetical protein DRO61_08225 [Candidatus Bathyarchaeota archaeon]|nr:MAG: hypothetical protein DRO61_08225 [Candidatus Bathyarchaeota archaeon]